MHVIGQQLDRIKEKIVEKTVSGKFVSVKTEKPLIDLPSQREKVNFKTARTISKNEIVFYENIDSDTISVKKIFDDDLPEIKRFVGNPKLMSFTKNWYSKLTLPDMQFEEKAFQTQFSVSTIKLYEWNIDGLSEQEIINKMGHMSMVGIAYQNNHDLD